MTVPVRAAAQGDIIESVIAKGDLTRLTPEERTQYYVQLCRSMGLNPHTQPFAYINLNGKLTLYAKRDAADQLRKINGISISIVSQEAADGLLSIHVKASDKTGRSDEDLGVVAFPETLKGEARANAILKAVTKAKRRVTLSISGLGFLDETEVEDIPAASKRPAPPAPNVMLPLLEEHDPETGEVIDGSPTPSRPAVAAPSSLPIEDGETESERIARFDNLLSEAAEKGMAALIEAWAAVPNDLRKSLEAAKDRRYKPRAAEVDAQ